MSGYRERALSILTAVYGPGPHSEAAIGVQISNMRAADDGPDGDDFAHLDYEPRDHFDTSTTQGASRAR